jgi:hypothetical protein
MVEVKIVGVLIAALKVSTPRERRDRERKKER